MTQVELEMYSLLRHLVAKAFELRLQAGYSYEEQQQFHNIPAEHFNQILTPGGYCVGMTLLGQIASELGVQFGASWLKFPILHRNHWRSDTPYVIKLRDGTRTVAYPCEFEGPKENGEGITAFYHGRGYKTWMVVDNRFHHVDGYELGKAYYVDARNVIEFEALTEVKDQG